MSEITTVGQVMTYLPPNLPTHITSTVMYTKIQAAHEDFESKVTPVAVSSGSARDREIETMLAAILVRLDIPGLSEEEGSRTVFMSEYVGSMIAAKASGQTVVSEERLPVGPFGRDAVGAKVNPIFGAPKPETDEYEGKYADDDLGRPGSYR